MAGKIQNEDIKSSAELIAAGGANSQLPNDTKVWLTGSSQTLAAAIAAGFFSAGGGAGGLRWVDGTPAPNIQQQFGTNTYGFGSGDTQTETCMIMVPQSYVAGKQIKLYADFFSPDSSGTALMTTVATLIRPGSDAISSTTNQRTSTNSALTLTSGTVNKPQQVTFDLTDTSGNINGVAVAAGNLIIVSLSRGTDTATSDLQNLLDASGVSFNG